MTAHFTVETVLADPIRFGRTPTGGIVIDFAADSEAAVYQNVDGARVCAEQARIGSQTAELREFLRQFFD